MLLSNRSHALLQLRQLDLAIKDARHCVALRPTWGKAHFRLAAALTAKGNSSDACAALLDLQILQEGSFDDESVLHLMRRNHYHTDRKVLERGARWSLVLHKERVLVVDQRGARHFETIREAIQHADEGEKPASIIIKPGLYYEHLVLRSKRCGELIGDANGDADSVTVRVDDRYVVQWNELGRGFDLLRVLRVGFGRSLALPPVLSAGTFVRLRGIRFEALYTAKKSGGDPRHCFGAITMGGAHCHGCSFSCLTFLPCSRPFLVTPLHFSYVASSRWASLFCCLQEGHHLRKDLVELSGAEHLVQQTLTGITFTTCVCF